MSNQQATPGTRSRIVSSANTETSSPAGESAAGAAQNTQQSAPIQRTISRSGAATAPISRTTAPKAGDSSWMKTGVQARNAAETEMARQKEAAARRASGLYMPFRFWTAIGVTSDVIVLDNVIGPCFYEHNLKDRAGKFSIFESCPKEYEPCPICDGVAGGKESYYVMMLTVIDLTLYTTKEGKVVNHSRKLLPVKAGGQGFFARQFDRRGSLRGMHLQMNRDTTTSPSIGVPELFMTQDFSGFHSEEAILESFGHAAVLGPDGKVIKQANADCFPFEYEKLFKKPSGEDLRKRYGGNAPVGSSQEYLESSTCGAAGTDIPF